MSTDIKDFYGQDVQSAIKEACEALGVAQENLTIEVIETGSKGIFGLIRRKAHIRVSIQSSAKETETETIPEPPPQQTERSTKQTSKRKSGNRRTREAAAKQSRPSAASEEAEQLLVEPDENADDDEDNGSEPIELSPQTLTVIREELGRLLDLMGCPSTVTIENHDGTALCSVNDEHESVLTSQEGRTLDSLQYILRKIVSRKIPGRVQLSIDVGNYRARRHNELRELALKHAAQVKDDGKTQVIPALNPSERRVVHVSLQDDPEIRSRSIGEGLFKKVLIYKPGKTRKTGRKRTHGNIRKKGAPKKES